MPQVLGAVHVVGIEGLKVTTSQFDGLLDIAPRLVSL
jgi:hypothetical protein